MTEAPKPISRRIFCGLTWPERGYPAYCCVIGEKIVDKTKTFDAPAGLEIFLEHEAKTLSDLFEFFGELREIRCNTVCANLDRKYHSYVREFARWRRESGSSLRLKATNSSSFEASLMKVKEAIVSSILTFPEVSEVKSQLSIFSRNSLAATEEFYAVKALTMAIGEFTKRVQTEGAEKEPKRKAWY